MVSFFYQIDIWEALQTSQKEGGDSGSQQSTPNHVLPPSSIEESQLQR